MGLPHVDSIVWRKNGKGRGRVYKFWRDHTKVKFMEALVGEGNVLGRP